MPADQELQLLGRLMDVAVLSNQVHASNLANSNTPGYRAKAVEFDNAFQSALTEAGPEAAEQVEPVITEPHSTPIQADGNDVSEETEIVGSAKNQALYDAYVQMARGELRLLGLAVTPAPGG
jgi:flagellar basal-body rod protein FlgB